MVLENQSRSAKDNFYSLPGALPALLLAQLWDKARSSIVITEEQIFLWSDATIAVDFVVLKEMDL